MRKISGVTFAGWVISFSVSAMVAQQPVRVRGTIQSVHGNTLAIKSYDGKPIDVALESGTKYAWVVPSSLSDIKSGDFIGTAATGPENDMKAQEVVIFPNSMRGTGEGHYAWSMPEAVANADAHGSGSSSDTMTNGTMTNGTMTNGTMTNGTMTNGTMTNGTMSNGTMTNGTMTNGTMTNGTMTNGTVATGSTSNGRQLTISYNNGQKAEVMASPNTPVVRFVPAQSSVLSPGSKVFILAAKTSGDLHANFVAVGKNGLMPPM